MSTSKVTKIQHGSYTLYKSQAILFPYEVYLNAFKISHLLTWSLWLLHIVILFALAYQIQRDEPHMPWKVWIALFCELFLAIPEAVTACTIVLALFSGKSAQPRADYRLHLHNSTRSVDGRKENSINLNNRSCVDTSSPEIIVADAGRDYYRRDKGRIVHVLSRNRQL